MKLLQINCVYLKGSTGKITQCIHETLAEQGVESLVCYGRGEEVDSPGVIKTCGEVYAKLNNLRSRITGLMYGGCGVSTARLIRIIEKEKPDVVHLQCINGYFVNIYRLVRWLNDNKIKTVLTLHAEFMYTANCGHAFECENWKSGCGNCPDRKKATKSLFFDRTADSFRKMRAAFTDFGERIAVVSVSPWLMERAKQSPILADLEHRVVLNGVDTEVFACRDRDALRRQYGLEGERMVFHVTADFCDTPGHGKGGSHVIELARRNPDVKFYVAAGRQQIHSGLPENLVLLGNIRDQQILAQYYAMADVTLVTSRRETFSMPCAESLCCGTPVVGFRAGAPEMIALPQYSEFVPYGDLEALNTALHARLDQPADRIAVSNMAAETYSDQTMAENYLKIYRTLCGG